MSFSELQLHPTLLRSLDRLGYQQPAPIQRAVIPHVLARRDVLAYACYGSGKDGAIVLPVLQRLLEDAPTGISALILAARLERAVRLEQALHELGGPEARSCVLYGVAGLGALNMAAQQDHRMIVTTPERMAAHLGRSYMRLNGVHMLVLDEADKMLARDMRSLVERIVDELPADRQTLIFADAAAPPIEALSNALQRDPVATAPDHEAASPAGVAQVVWPAPRHLKTRLLARLADEFKLKRTLVLVHDGSLVTQVVRKLRTRDRRVAALLSQHPADKRQAVCQGFLSGKHRLLVTSGDVFGEIDLGRVLHVVTYDLPATPEDCVARLQRMPQAVFFHLVSPDEEDVLRRLEVKLGRPLRREELSDFDYDAPALRSEGRPRRSPPREVATEPTLPLTWGDRDAPRRDPEKILLAEWKPEPLPAVWRESNEQEKATGKPKRGTGSKTGRRRKSGGRSRRRGRRKRSGGGKKEGAEHKSKRSRKR